VERRVNHLPPLLSAAILRLAARAFHGLVFNVHLTSGVTKSRGSSKNGGNSPCGRYEALEANDHETVEYFVSLLDQQDEMWAKGKSAEAKELEGVISRARQAVVQARTYLAMHRVNRRQN
jgi:hypothetical protein